MNPRKEVEDASRPVDGKQQDEKELEDLMRQRHDKSCGIRTRGCTYLSSENSGQRMQACVTFPGS